MTTLATKNISTLGIFSSQLEVERCVDRLRADGFRKSDVSILMPASTSTRDFGHEKGSKAPEGAATGVSAGAAIGGTLGWLAGIGALAVPAIGPFIAAGPLMGLLAGVGVGGAVGGIAGGLIGFGIPEYEAKRYEGFVKRGGILLSVHADNRDWANKAETILKECGAREISKTAEASADTKAHVA